jgi:hypothetical protein
MLLSTLLLATWLDAGALHAPRWWANVNAKQSTIGAGPRLQIRVF